MSHLLGKAASTTSALLSARYEKEAEDAIEAEQYHIQKLADLNAKLAEIDSLVDAVKNNSVFTKETLFASDSITRELIDLYIERIEIDESNDNIVIDFKETI